MQPPATTAAISRASPSWREKTGNRTVHNVIGYLPGTNPAYADHAVLITAHYDHLGRGWPNARQSDAGQIHPGADDNASGVAVLIELARNFAAGAPPERNLAFVAFSAEEAGLLGSRHYAEHPRPAPLEGIVGVINLDSVGRLEDQPISVLATGSAMEWPFVFRGVSAVTGIPSESIAGAAASSDQRSFIERGVPGVQFHRTHLTTPARPPTRSRPGGQGRRHSSRKRRATWWARDAPMVRVRRATARFRSRNDRRDTGRQAERVSFGYRARFRPQSEGGAGGSLVPGYPAERLITGRMYCWR